MRLGPFATALTLVGTLTTASWAAPLQTDPDLDTDEKNNPSRPTSPSTEFETLNIANPPPPRLQEKEVSREIFFPFQSSVSPRLGVGTKNQTLNGTPYFYFLGLNYMVEATTSKHYEVGIDLTSDALGLLHLGHKWIFNHTTAFRPYFKAGPTIKMVADQQLATFLKYENYQFRICGGFEKLLKAPMSLRIDLEAALVSGGYEVSFATGYSWAW